MKSRVLSLLFLLTTSTFASAQLSPEKGVKTFKVTPGLEFTLWASEPECVNPTCMDVDHRGRVWTCESINYRQKLRGEKKMRRPEGDRILILEDRKGTGKCDTATVFYQAPEIHAPLGIAVYPYPDGKGVKVYVCQSPDIWVFEDKNDDGKADGPPTKLLTGFRGVDHDHGVHGILIGPDNRLYFTVGDSGVGNLQSSDGKGPKFSSNDKDVRAATVWRCDLDGKNLQLIAHNFRNNYEPCVDSFGNVFLSDNDDDGNQQTRICFVMQGGNYGYHRSPKTSHWNEEHPGIVPKIIRTYFGSPTGICMYEGDLLPKEYKGNILHTDAGPRHVRCYHLTPSGAAFSVKQENTVESTDNWFRPSDVTVAPDGSVFVCDWYDPGVGGHGVGDFTRGRIYRLAPPGSKPSVPKTDLSTDKGILAALASPNLAARAIAMAKIHEIGGEKAIEILTPAAAQKENPVLRARALWQMGKLKHLRFVNAAFSDPDDRFRVLAMRILHDTHGTTPVDYDEKWQKDLVMDKSAHVRREALLLLQDVEPTKAAPLFYTLAKQFDGKDRFYLATIGIAAGNTDMKRRERMLADFSKHFADWNPALAGLLWELRPSGALALLEPQVKNVKLSTEQRLQVIDTLAEIKDIKAGEALISVLKTNPPEEVQERILTRLQEGMGGPYKALKGNKELAEVTSAMFTNPKTRHVGVTLAGLTGNVKFLDETVKIATDAKETLPLRLAAVRALANISASAEVLGKLGELAASKDAPVELRQAAVATLGKDWNWVSATRIMTMLTPESAIDLPVRQQVVAAAAAHKPGAEYLLTSYQEKKINKDLTADLSRLLRNSPFPDIKKKAQGMLPAPPKLDPKLLPSIPALLTRKGNVEKGRQIYLASLKSNVQCMKCHTVNREGGNVGPDLSAIGSKESREKLLESILYPDRAINHHYVTWVIEDQDGKIYQGVIGEEQPGFLTLRDANVKEYKILTKDIANKKKIEKSIMPDNLLLYMSEEELIDLVEYLYSLKSTPVPAARREDVNERVIARLD